MNLEFLKSLEFLLSKVKINNVWADFADKSKFKKDFLEGKIKSRMYLYNGIIDIETE